MKTTSPKTRFWYALGFLSAAIMIIALLSFLLLMVGSNKNTNDEPKVIVKENVIHSQVIHRSIIEQLSIIEGDTSGYLPTTVIMQPNTSSQQDDALVTEVRYIGEIVTHQGQRYALDIELLQIGDEVIPVAVSLNPIQETQS